MRFRNKTTTRLYLDSANLDEIRTVADMRSIHGVTTNPSLMAKEPRGDYEQRIVQIRDILNESFMHLSVEVISLDPAEMERQALVLRKLVEKNSLNVDSKIDFHVKIPVTFETMPLMTKLKKKENVSVNATACMTADQAKMAWDAGATAVSFFYNRMKDVGLDPLDEIDRFRRWVGWDAEVICGSIRKPADVGDCWDAGASSVTAPLHVIKLLLKHHKTDEAIAQFQEDIDRWLG